MIDQDYSLTAYNGMNDAALAKRVEEVKAAGVQREMPRYRCHKDVWALKIADVRPAVGEPDTKARILIPADEGFAPFVVDGDYASKHDPQPGGYYVQYKDGYKSFSPAGAFEDGYTRI